MFMVNTYRWDYPQVAALVAPRPLLIGNTDSDGIFPLDGVVRTFDKVRRIYRLFDAEKNGTSTNVALNIEPGPHKDTQELQTNEFRWFNHYLKNDDSLIDSRAPNTSSPSSSRSSTSCRRIRLTRRFMRRLWRRRRRTKFLPDESRMEENAG